MRRLPRRLRTREINNEQLTINNGGTARGAGIIRIAMQTI